MEYQGAGRVESVPSSSISDGIRSGGRQSLMQRSTPPFNTSNGLNNQRKPEKGICIVSFDGSGPGVISQLVILDGIMTRIAYGTHIDDTELLPAHYFDFMGGVGFGGLAALLLGRLCLTPSQAMEEVYKIAAATFPKEYNQGITPGTRISQLKNATENMLQRNGHSLNMRLRDGSAQLCKVVVFAAAQIDMQHCQAFRTYASPQRSLDCTFVEAVCAILANPEYFSAYSIGPEWRKQTFAGVPYGYSNPMRVVLREARLVFGDRTTVSLALSLGSGENAIVPNSEHGTTTLTRLLREPNMVANELSHQLSGAAAYLRLNVDKGIDDSQESGWHNLGAIVTHTEVYLEMSMIMAHMDEVSQWIVQRNGDITLGELNGMGGKTPIKFRSQRFNDYLEMDVKQMCDIMQQVIEKITFVDAVGARIPILLQWCQPYELFKNIIHAYFKHHRLTGCTLVQRGDYQLVSGKQKASVKPSGWDDLLAPGIKVEISMIIRSSGMDRNNCPRCGLISTGMVKNEWATCVSCHLQFRVTDDITREDVLVTPAVYVQQRIPSHIARLIPARQASRELVDDDEGHQREEGDRADQGETPQREDLPKEGLQKVGPQKVEEHKDISDTEEWKRFRLISIPNLLSEIQFHPQHDSIHPVLANLLNQGGGMSPRAIPKRRRSNSNPHNPGMSNHQTAGPPPSNVDDSPLTKRPRLELYTVNVGNEGDVELAMGSVNLRKTLPTVTPKGGHPHPHHRRVPTIAVADWDTFMSYQHPPPAGPSHSYHNQGAPHSSAVPPSQQQSRPYPSDYVTLAAAPVSLGRSTSLSKQKQQEQRNEVDEAKLSHAFTPGSFRHDPALQFFLQAIRNSRFYRDDQHEPLLGSPEAEHLLSMVRGRFPHDARFVPRADAGYERGPIDNDTRESQSILMLFTENNQCLICGQRKDRTGRALGHVRSDIGHRPYHCHCEKCLQSPNPRRFFSDSLLDDHIKGQMAKQECQVCHSLFRRGGMKRHMESKHRDVQSCVDEEDL